MDEKRKGYLPQEIRQRRKKLGNYIKAIRQELGLTLEEMGQRIGVSHSSLHRFENGEGDVESSLPAIASLIGISELELLIKAGVYDIDYIEKVLAKTKGEAMPHSIEVIEKNFYRIPIISKVGAGGKVYAEHYVLYERTYPPPSQVKGFVVNGDSMEPVLHDGDIVLIDISDKQLQDGKIYLFAQTEGSDGSNLLLRIARRIDSDWYMLPANPNYSAGKLSSDWVVVGRAIEKQTIQRTTL